MTLVLKASEMPVSPPIAIPRRLLFLGAVAAFMIGGVLGCALAFYGAQAHHGVARAIARIVPLPAARIDGQWVWYREISERANALETIAGLPDDEAVLRAIDLAERAAIVRMMARELGVSVSDDDVEHFVTEDAELLALRDRAGWSQTDYERYGVRPYLLAAKTEAALLASSLEQSQAKGRLERVLAKFESGIPFADLALAYSEGENAYLGGDLGYVELAVLPEAYQQAVQDLAVEHVSDIVETEKSFVALYVVDAIPATGDAAGLVRLRVIEIKKDLLGDIVDRQLLTTKITLWLR